MGGAVKKQRVYKGLITFWAVLGLGSLTLGSLSMAQNLGAELVTAGNDRGATACAMCHLPDGAGNGAAGYPRLAGLEAEYLVKQLRDYQVGTRQDSVMVAIANALNDEEIREVTRYYAEQRAVAAVTNAPVEVLELGKRLSESGQWNSFIPPCESCHGPNNMGLGVTFPSLAGQHASYIAKQLRNWQAGMRSNDPQALMATVARRMSDAQIDAVAAYLATLEPKGDSQ